MHTALTIAGSDSSGGAGIQADIKTMMANGVYAMSVITAVTAQNTRQVTSICNLTPSFVGQQLDAVFTDIPPDAVKIGMVSSADLIVEIADKLKSYKAERIVLDPVMVATSGSSLMQDEALDALKQYLLPLATLVTPNIHEAETLTGHTIRTAEDMERVARYIYEHYGTAALCKGGHSLNDANDYLYTRERGRWYTSERIHNPNTHGTGCTLSSAIAAYLAQGYALEDAIERAKMYLTGALRDMLDLGQGSGPLNHGYRIQIDDSKS